MFPPARQKTYLKTKPSSGELSLLQKLPSLPILTSGFADSDHVTGWAAMTSLLCMQAGVLPLAQSSKGMA